MSLDDGIKAVVSRMAQEVSAVRAEVGGDSSSVRASRWHFPTVENDFYHENVASPINGDAFLYASGDFFYYDGAAWVYSGNLKGAPGSPGTGVAVIGASDDVPGGTPAGTVVFRTP